MAIVPRLGLVCPRLLEHDDLERLATVRLAAPGSGMPVIVDLLFGPSGIEDEIVRDAERVEIVNGSTLPVARAGHLIALDDPFG